MAQSAYVGTKLALNPVDLVESTVKLNTDAEMPVIGFGTYLIKGQKNIYDALDAALVAGYRNIDTAAVYENEVEIKNALKDLLPKYNLSRKDIFITSKLSPQDQGADKVHGAITDSLRRLGVDYIDLYLIHWPGVHRTPVDSKENRRLRMESWRGLEDMYKAGKLKAIGVSNYTTRHLEELLKICSVKPAVNQVEFHPHYRQSEDLECLCARNNILLQSYSTLGSAGGTKNLLSDPAVLQVANTVGKTSAQVLLRWALQRGYAIIPKSVSPERIAENADLNFELDSACMALVDGISTRQKYTWNPDTVV